MGGKGASVTQPITETFTAAQHGTVLEVVFSPPAKAEPDLAARVALMALLTGIPNDINGVLLRSGARTFSAGAVLPQAEDALTPDLAALCAAVEGCRVPVTFLIEGWVGGAMAEIALAAHQRLAPTEARLTIGTMAFGLISGAGGTQRVAALVGAEQALWLMRGGVALSAPDALALGLIDRVIKADGRNALHGAARGLAADGAAHTDRAGWQDAGEFLAAVAEARLVENSRAETALIDCIEAAILLPRPQALAFEASVAEALAASDEAAALCHIYRAERQAARQAGPNPAAVVHLGLIGGAMSLVGVTLTALARGIGVTLVETNREMLVDFLKAIAARQEALVQAGHITDAQRDADWARLVPVAEADAVAACDLVIAGDSATVPSGTFPVLMCGHGPLLPGAFRLTLTGRVAELGLPVGADAAAVALTLGFFSRLGLVAVRTGAQDTRGIAERLAAASAAALGAMVVLGVPPVAIAAALTVFGLPAPPLRDGPALTPRTMPSDEIVNRLMAALANEGARILTEGLAQTALEIDLVAVHGLGFPRDRGGPLHQAERRGLLVVRRDLSLWADEAEVWRPVPALDAFVSVGRGFEGAAVRTG
jgi:3-hydroxyacyl-CoA dehydrogenase